MWIVYVMIGLVVLVVPIVLFLTMTTVRKKKASDKQNLLTELKNLKETGLITESEYNDKVAEIKTRKGGKDE